MCLFGSSSCFLRVLCSGRNSGTAQTSFDLPERKHTGKTGSAPDRPETFPAESVPSEVDPLIRPRTEVRETSGDQLPPHQQSPVKPPSQPAHPGGRATSSIPAGEPRSPISHTDSYGQPKPSRRVDPRALPNASPGTGSCAETRPSPLSDSWTEPRTEPNPDSQPNPASHIDSSTEPNPASRTDSRTGTNPASRADSWIEPNPASRTDSWTDPNPVSRTDSWPEPNPRPRAWAQPNPVPGTDSWTEPQPDSSEDSWAGPNPHTDSWTEPIPKEFKPSAPAESQTDLNRRGDPLIRPSPRAAAWTEPNPRGDPRSQLEGYRTPSRHHGQREPRPAHDPLPEVAHPVEPQPLPHRRVEPPPLKHRPLFLRCRELETKYHNGEHLNHEAKDSKELFDAIDSFNSMYLCLLQ